MKKSSPGSYHTLVVGIGSVTAVALAVLALMLIVSLVNKTLKPAPVVTRCEASGESVLHETTITPDGTNEKAVKFFLRRFFTLYIQKERLQSTDSRSADELHYMMTPQYEQQIQLDAYKPPKWEDKDTEVDFVVRGVKINGSMKNGEQLNIMGTGDLIFRPKATLAAEGAVSETVATFFQATVFVYRVTEKTPWGLMMHWGNTVFFASPELLDKFLESAEKTQEKK